MYFYVLESMNNTLLSGDQLKGNAKVFFFNIRTFIIQITLIFLYSKITILQFHNLICG